MAGSGTGVAVGGLWVVGWLGGSERERWPTAKVDGQLRAATPPSPPCSSLPACPAQPAPNQTRRKRSDALQQQPHHLGIVVVDRVGVEEDRHLRCCQVR